MGKTKLRKIEGGSSTRTAKSIQVEDVKGNRHILKATVITVSKSESAEITDEKMSQLGFSSGIIKPPLNQAELAVLSEVSSELGQVIDSMAVGIHGFGGRLKKRKMTKEQELKFKVEIAEEKAFLDGLVHFPNPKQSFKKMLKSTRKSYENTGNSYWELIRTINPDRYSCINKLDSGTMFIVKQDKNFGRKKLKYVDENLKMRSRGFMWKFRKYVQVVGNKKAFYKEYGDTRIIDRRDGLVIAANMKDWKRKAEDTEFARRFPKKIWANEVYHFRLETSRRTPYGMPRYTGNIIAIKGSRSADETNIITQQNNHVPSMAISVAGGQLTEGSITRIKEFVDVQIKGDSNYSKFLILEGESSHDSLSSAGSVKIDIKPLSDNQIKDQLWQQYDDNNASKIRRSFRMPPIMVGETRNLNRATAQESERMAEKWVYNPEREDMDEDINQIFMQQGFRFWVWKSNSPNITNDQDLVKILTGAEKTGGLSPRIARKVLEDIMPEIIQLPPVPEADPKTGWDPDLPFSYSLARLIQGAGAANAAGTLSPQGQVPKPPGQPGRPRNNNTVRDADKVMADMFEKIEPEKILNNLLQHPDDTLETLLYMRDRLEDELDTETFGEPQGGFFEHAS